MRSLVRIGIASLSLAVALAADVARAQILDVPGPNTPTIQSAIDALPNGGTVRLAVKTYKEHVVVSGRQIVLESAGAANAKRPTIKSDDPENAIVTFTNGGGGTVRNLVLRGGRFGIAAGPDESEQCGAGASAVVVDGAQIVKAGRGIYGSFASLAIQGGEIAKSASHGVALVTVGDVVIDGASIHDNAGAGLLVLNYVAPQGASSRQIKNCEIFKNAGGGIDVRGHALPVAIDNCTVRQNRIFGVNLLGANDTTITNSALSFTLPEPGVEKWGDGLRVFRSSPVTLTATTLAFNARAGASAFGCDGGLQSTVAVMDASFNNPIDLDAGKLETCASPQSTPIFSDDGGNTCFVGACVIASSDLTPIPPPATP